MSDRAQLEAAYRAPYRAMRAAQDRSAEAAQRRARDERREAEDRFEEAKLAVHCAIVDGRDE
jgi:hypothetical protein